MGHRHWYRRWRGEGDRRLVRGGGGGGGWLIGRGIAATAGEEKVIEFFLIFLFLEIIDLSHLCNQIAQIKI